MAHLFQCDFVSDDGIECQMPRHHVDSMDIDKQWHFASNEDGIPTLKVWPKESERTSGGTK